MIVQSGQERLPDVTLARLQVEDGEASLEEVRIRDYGTGRRVILVGMPGPFTPTCSRNHLPGFLHRRQELLDAGAAAIAVIAVTDAYAMDAWATTTGARGLIDFLADGNADFVIQASLDEDRSEDQMGMRSARFALIAEDNVVLWLAIEARQGETQVTDADRVLEALRALD